MKTLPPQTGINLNSVRHTLYTLYEKRLAEYHRIKNNETGWLTYLWQLRKDHIYDAIREDMSMVLEKLSAGKNTRRRMTSISARTARSSSPSPLP